MVLPNIVDPNIVFGDKFWLAAATGAVRRYCGWHVAPEIEETLVLDGTGGRVLLVPSDRVVDVVSVTDCGTDVTADVDFSVAGVLVRTSGCWSSRVGQVVVTLRHGWDLEDVPDVAGVIAAVRGRAIAGAGGIAGQTIGPASVRHAVGRDGGALGVPLLQSEKEALAPYRLVWGP